MHIKPQLSYRNNRWNLSYTVRNGDDSYSVTLIITHSWDGETWNRYKVEVWEDGESFELVEPEVWSNRYETIIMHEGIEEADKWADAGTVRCNSMVSSKYQKAMSIANALKLRWESMLALELFSPSVTL